MRWADLVTIDQEFLYGRSDGNSYYRTGTSDNGSDMDGYRIEPMISFGDGFQKSLLNEIWFYLNTQGSHSLYCYYRGGDTEHNVRSKQWEALPELLLWGGGGSGSSYEITGSHPGTWYATVAAGETYYYVGYRMLQSVPNVYKAEINLTYASGDITTNTYYLELWNMDGVNLDSKFADLGNVVGDNGWGGTWVEYEFVEPVTFEEGQAVVLTARESDLVNLVVWYGDSKDDFSDWDDGFGRAQTWDSGLSRGNNYDAGAQLYIKLYYITESGKTAIYTNKLNRIHQIKWGTDGKAEPFGVHGIEYSFVPQGRY
jgi:hypothetical protein